ncbi:MAG: GWxTD domain-containing protein [Ignavibacteriaceae bacterium]|nr:GWxTD domain-containing protein [Ignavibacteriaceae bacterium]
MKKILFSFFLICNSLFGQPNTNVPPTAPRFPFESELISLPRIDGDFSVFYIYKIPYKMLVFERKEESFNAGFRVVVEILDKDDKLVSRDIKDNRVTVNNFEETNDLSFVLQDFISFKIKPGEYKISTLISDMNSTGELLLEPKGLNLEKSKDKLVQHPLVINSQEIFCDEKKAFTLANSGGNVPFSSDKFHLIIPITDTSITEIDVIIENNDEVIISTKVNESYVIPIGIAECEKHLSVTRNPETIALRNFVVRNVNEKLSEGEVTLNVTNEENSIDEEYSFKIVWFNKPFSLMDPEKAIEFLNFVESDSVVSSLLSNSDSDYPLVLKDYWSKYDPTSQTTYNEVMSEYYTRVDYAIKEFKGIGKGNGAKTDRGVVYIKFGNPDKIERSSNPQGQVMEIWSYLNPERKFTFIDKKGTGNFSLTEN